MAVVALIPRGMAAPDPAFRWSLAGHGLLLLVVLIGGLSIPRSPPPSQLAIKATVVDRNVTRPPGKPLPPAQQSTPKPPPEAKPEAKPEPKPDPRLEERRIEQQKVERQQAVQREKAVQEKQRAEQRKAQQAAEKKQQEKLQRQKEEKQAQEKAAADNLQAEKLKAAKVKEEAAQREIARQLEAEEHLLAAQQSGALAEYLGLISQKVTRNWIRPPSARAGLEAVVLVTQIPGGEVISAQIVSCNGDEAVCRSIQSAVLRASPLPLPDDPLLFDRSLRFTFKPEQ